MDQNRLYQPELLANLLAIFQKKLPAYLNKSQQEPNNVHQYQTPKELFHLSESLLKNPEVSEKKLEQIVEQFLTYARPLQSPHYIGHQVAVPIPWAGLMKGLSGVINQGAAVFEMGPLVLAAERAVVKRLASFISKTHEFEGVVTHGGTLANLTGLLAARNSYYEGSFNQGVKSSKGKPAIITSSEAHYSMARAMGVMGLGSEQLLKAPINPHTRKIDKEKFESFYQQKTKEGFDIFSIVGSACSTPTGAIDDLNFLGEFCEKNKIWFHVDAAHGGGFLLSEKLRPLFHGIEKADSIAWDAHKMMFVPALTTFVFYKNKKHSYQTFSQEAPYLFDPAMSDLDFESGLRTFECTKGDIILPLFTVLSTIGTSGIATLLESLVQETQNFYQLIEKSDDFEALHYPETNIFCFRYFPKNIGKDDLDRIQDQVRIKLIQAGDFYITGTLLEGKRCLRVTVMNPLTKEKDFQKLMDSIRTFSF